MLFFVILDFCVGFVIILIGFICVYWVRCDWCFEFVFYNFLLFVLILNLWVMIYDCYNVIVCFFKYIICMIIKWMLILIFLFWIMILFVLFICFLWLYDDFGIKVDFYYRVVIDLWFGVFICLLFLVIYVKILIIICKYFWYVVFLRV